MIIKLFKRIIKPNQYEGVRIEKIITSCDGLYFNSTPQEITQIIKELFKKVQEKLENPSLIIGLDSAGIVPACFLSSLTGLPFAICSKLNIETDTKSLKFSEKNAIRKNIYFHNIPRLKNQKILLIDDEVTTGQTIINLTNNIHQQTNSQIVGLVSLVEVTNYGARDRLSNAGIELISHRKFSY